MCGANRRTGTGGHQGKAYCGVSCLKCQPGDFTLNSTKGTTTSACMVAIVRIKKERLANEEIKPLLIWQFVLLVYQALLVFELSEMLIILLSDCLPGEKVLPYCRHKFIDGIACALHGERIVELEDH